MDKVYTVSDWKNGVIHQDFKNGKMPQTIYDNVKNIGYLSTLLQRQNLLSKSDFEEIESIMKETFFKVLDHNVEQRLQFFKPTLESAYRRDLLIEERIDELQRTLDKADNYHKEQAFIGEWSKIGIDYEVYRKVNDEDYKAIPVSLIQFTPSNKFKDRLGGFHKVFTDKYYLRQNVIFDVSEILRFRERLIEFKNEISEANSDKRKQGTHLDKKMWIKDKFDELRPESSSDNEAVESVMKAYHEKFEKKIGKSTAQRYIGLVK